MTQPVISSEQVVRSYGSKRALDGVDLDLNAGDGITAILGPNGAGKTTFVNCCLGLTPTSKGRLRVFGSRPGSLMNRRRIGAMLQNTDLPELLTAREHITLFASYYPNPMTTDECLTLCEIERFADTSYKKLSGGQKRRVQFALSLVGRPDLIFLDEPTTGLDIDARRVLWTTIRQLADTGTSVILTTHYLEEADALAERIVLIDGGRVVADAPTQDIRDAVGGAVIQCVTRLDDAFLESLPAVRSVNRSGRFVEILSADTPSTLRALLDADQDLQELTVRKPSLEDAFVELTQAKEDV